MAEVEIRTLGPVVDVSGPFQGDSRVAAKPGPRLAILSGEMDHAGSASLADILMKALAEGRGQLVLDLRQVTYMDSGGLGLLITLAQEVAAGGLLALYAPKPNVLRLVQTLGVLSQPQVTLLSSEAELEALARAEGL